jgi:ubiquinone/menaquinone biosynthesis C-methylase UbiE
MTPDIGKSFTGSIPQVYESHLVPMLFAPYAADLVDRLRRHPVSGVLEMAAGTGVVTRAMASALPDNASIVATDLNQPMLDEATRIGSPRRVKWQQADAMQLPFAEATFDAVVCQFGVMFFSDRPKAYAEVRRVLKPSGIFLFNVWDRIEENDFPQLVQCALDSMFPASPPRFLAQIPHGYSDARAIERDLGDAGFAHMPEMVTVAKRSRAESARFAAIAFCQGTPLRAEIEARDGSRLDEATDLAAELIAQQFGYAPVDGKIQAHVVEVRK